MIVYLSKVDILSKEQIEDFVKGKKFKIYEFEELKKELLK